MQFLKINESTTLSDVSNQIGYRNIDHTLSVNGLSRTPFIGNQLATKCNEIIRNHEAITPSRKISIMNTFTQDSDIFEQAALLSESGWAIMSQLGTFYNMLRIPDSITLPDATNILGNGLKVAKITYEKIISSIRNNNDVDPSALAVYSTSPTSKIIEARSNDSNDPMKWFHIPWGEITLHSSLDNTSVEFPVYPEEVSDGRKANYTTMPDMLMQYEPWQIYNSSGPRSNTYTFRFHRDMWTGDHRDNKAIELIRFCEALCYPKYAGSAVNTAIATLYVAGNELISGIVTDVTENWSGPIGLDGYYLMCELSISFTEISKSALSYDTVKQKGVIA